MRQRRAHRTGLQARTAGHRSIDASHYRLASGNPFRRHASARRPCPASGHSAPCRRDGSASQRKSLLRTRRPDAGMRGATSSIPAKLRCNSICERAKTKRPRFGTRGRSRILGRSGSPIFRSKEDQQGVGSNSLRSPTQGRYAGASTRCPRLAGRRVIDFAMWKECVMEVRWVAIRRDDEGRARYAAGMRAASDCVDTS